MTLAGRKLNMAGDRMEKAEDGWKGCWKAEQAGDRLYRLVANSTGWWQAEMSKMAEQVVDRLNRLVEAQISFGDKSVKEPSI